MRRRPPTGSMPHRPAHEVAPTRKAADKDQAPEPRGRIPWRAAPFPSPWERRKGRAQRKGAPARAPRPTVRTAGHDGLQHAGAGAAKSITCQRTGSTGTRRAPPPRTSVTRRRPSDPPDTPAARHGDRAVREEHDQLDVRREAEELESGRVPDATPTRRRNRGVPEQGCGAALHLSGDRRLCSKRGSPTRLPGFARGRAHPSHHPDEAQGQVALYGGGLDDPLGGIYHALPLITGKACTRPGRRRPPGAGGFRDHPSRRIALPFGIRAEPGPP